MSSGFVTETEAAEARKRRQEEWEKVRTPDQPLERPEEPYDGRSLYDRLKEQKMKKDMEYEETHKLKNLIRGLDDDEVQFLELVDKSKIDAEKKQMQEEAQELKEFRNRVATLQEESVDKKLQSEVKNVKPKLVGQSSAATRLTQKSLLAGIKRKNGDVEHSTTSKNSKCPAVQDSNNADDHNAAGSLHTAPEKETKTMAVVMHPERTALDRGHFRCVAILPGIGPYNDSSDSEISTDSDDDPEQECRYDLVGRKPQKKKQQCQSD